MTSDSPACIFRVLEGPIKEFVLTENSRHAVDALFDTAEKVLGEAAFKNDLHALSLPSLIDSGIGVQPLNHTLFRLRATMSKFPETRKGCIAVILPSSPLLKTLSMMTRSIAPIRLYTPQERDQALAWLRASCEPNR